MKKDFNNYQPNIKNKQERIKCTSSYQVSFFESYKIQQNFLLN